MNKETFFKDIKSYKFLANKSLGQNFLIESDIASNIVNTLSLENGDSVLEIGAGLGSLSYFLVNSTNNVTLIDVDENMINILKDKFKDTNVVRANILKYDISSFNKIIGNLPYYITSSIIEYLLLNGKNLKMATLMVQKEVYDKLFIKKEISPLSLLLNYLAVASKSNFVSRNCFSPVPHVDSVYFSLSFNEHIQSDNKELYILMTKLFIHRRKTILNNLTSILKDKQKAEQVLLDSNIKLSSRPEQLNILDYQNILKTLQFNNLLLKY